MKIGIFLPVDSGGILRLSNNVWSLVHVEPVGAGVGGVVAAGGGSRRPGLGSVLIVQLLIVIIITVIHDCY